MECTKQRISSQLPFAWIIFWLSLLHIMNYRQISMIPVRCTSEYEDFTPSNCYRARKNRSFSASSCQNLHDDVMRYKLILCSSLAAFPYISVPYYPIHIKDTWQHAVGERKSGYKFRLKFLRSALTPQVTYGLVLPQTVFYGEEPQERIIRHHVSQAKPRIACLDSALSRVAL